MNSTVARMAALEWPAVKHLLEPPSERSDRPAEPWFWEERVSPGFPADWPDSKALIYYVSAAGRNFIRLVDGEYFTAPWAVVKRDLAAGTYELVKDRRPPECAGTQGVRPLKPAEIAIMGDTRIDQDFAAALAAGAPIEAALARRVRDYYLLWRSCHGVGRLIEPKHERYFSWLRE